MPIWLSVLKLGAWISNWFRSDFKCPGRDRSPSTLWSDKLSWRSTRTFHSTLKTGIDPVHLQIEPELSPLACSHPSPPGVAWLLPWKNLPWEKSGHVTWAPCSLKATFSQTEATSRLIFEFWATPYPRLMSPLPAFFPLLFWRGHFMCFFSRSERN